MECYECGKKVSTSIVVCPHCGAPVTEVQSPPEQQQNATKSAERVGNLLIYPRGDGVPLEHKKPFSWGVVIVRALVVMIGFIVVLLGLLYRPSSQITSKPSQKEEIRMQTPPLTPSNNPLTKELNIGRYRVRLKREGPGNLIYFLDILVGGKRVYSINTKERGRGWLNVNFGENKNDSPLPLAGKEINGDGIPDLVVEDFSGGAHCCFSYLIFSLGTEFKQLTIGESESSVSFEFRDIDGDNVYELIGADSTFDYWQTSHADSPMPRIIMRYRNGSYGIAMDLMKKPPPRDHELNARIAAVKEVMNTRGNITALRERKWEDAGVPPLLWAYMLDLIYTGNGELGMKFFDTAWPNHIQGKKTFLEDFENKLKRSPYWPQIRLENNWQEHLPVEVKADQPLTGDTNTPTTSPARAASPSPRSMPANQASLLQRFQESCRSYDAQPNEIRKSEVFRNAARFYSEIGPVVAWVGILRRIATNQGGSNATLVIRMGSSDVLDNAVRLGSSVYSAAANMREGQAVVFSGTGLRDFNLTERGKVCNPDFKITLTSLQSAP